MRLDPKAILVKDSIVGDTDTDWELQSNGERQHCTAALAGE